MILLFKPLIHCHSESCLFKNTPWAKIYHKALCYRVATAFLSLQLPGAIGPKWRPLAGQAKRESLTYCWFCDTANLHLSLVPASITHYLNTHKQAYLRLFRSTCFCETEIWNRSGVYWKAHLKDLVIHGRKNILKHTFYFGWPWDFADFQLHSERNKCEIPDR